MAYSSCQTCGIDDKNDVSVDGDQIIVLDEVGIRFSPHRHPHHDA